MEIEELEGLAGTDLIQDTFLFQLLNFDETLAMAGLFKKESRNKGEVIIEERSLGKALYIVETGKVKVIKAEGKDKEELAVLGTGELFGEMSLIEDELTSATVVADTNVSLLVIKREDFEALLDQNMELALKIYKAFCITLSDRLRHTSMELSKLKAKTKKSSSKPDASRAKKKNAGKKAKK